MNTLESYEINTPDGGTGECSRFIVEDITIPFTLHNILTYGQQYALSMWVKSEVEEGVDKAVMVYGESMSALEDWNKYSHIFTAQKTDLEIYFSNTGVYYIYHPQLERGNIVTDWSESPYDTEKKISDIQDLYIKLEDSIQMVVQAINSGTLLEQTEDGWNFVTTGGTTEQLTELSNALKKLREEDLADLANKVEENSLLSTYVQIGKLYDEETGEPHPMIEMGVYSIDEDTNDGSFGEFKLRITETGLQFMQWDEPIAWLSNQQLHIRTAVIEEELAVGGFVLKQHGSRNNVGFLWKGVTS